MPIGRKPIITEIVLPQKREETYEKIRTQLNAGRQVYIICPRIDEPDPAKENALAAKSVKEEAKRIQKDIFPEYKIDILHSKMSTAEKERVMDEFKNGKTHILVATSVVELGVNVPNATIIIIEGGERFGLAQLHQLRGRVIRSSHQAYCFVFSDTKTKKSVERLSALKKAENGFKLAEYDLAQRGSGELSGRKQWGLTDIGMEAIKNIKMVEAARTEASKIIEKDPNLKTYPLLKEKISLQKQKIHFE
jgi:ATP-dependent DNA helicase RecG